MALNQTHRMKLAELKSDRDVLIAIQNLDDYAPSNAAFATKPLAAKLAALDVAHQAQINAENAAKAARDVATAAEWDFHNAILGAKKQVVAQYGEDSNEVQSLGLKKKSERKRPAARSRHTAATA